MKIQSNFSSTKTAQFIRRIPFSRKNTGLGSREAWVLFLMLFLRDAGQVSQLLALWVPNSTGMGGLGL